MSNKRNEVPRSRARWSLLPQQRPLVAIDEDGGSSGGKRSISSRHDPSLWFREQHDQRRRAVGNGAYTPKASIFL